MGLVLSHGNFGMTCSAFNRWRKFVLESIGGSYPPHKDPELSPDMWYWNKEGHWNSKNNPGLLELLTHEDNTGIITPENCKLIMDELHDIWSHLLKYADTLGPVGHIARNGGYINVTKMFIESCRLAYEKGENLEFR